jgi:hypothetical protein
MRLTQTQGKRLCELAHLIRPEWDIPGIESAVRAAAEKAPAADVAIALLALAKNPEVRTPGLLPKPGKHWPTDDEGNSVLPVSHNVRCVEHPLNVHPCPQCKAEKDSTPDRVPEYLEAKAALAARRPIPTVQKRLADFAASKEDQ